MSVIEELTGLTKNNLTRNLVDLLKKKHTDIIIEIVSVYSSMLKELAIGSKGKHSMCMVRDIVTNASIALNILLTTAIELKNNELVELAIELIDKSFSALIKYRENPLDCRPIEELGNIIDNILEKADIIVETKRSSAA